MRNGEALGPLDHGGRIDQNGGTSQEEEGDQNTQRIN